MILPADAAFWSVVVVFVSALSTTIIVVLRALTNGKIVVGRHYEDALRREESWRKAAETAMTTIGELSNHVGKLTSATEQSTAAIREAMLLLQRPTTVPPPPLNDTERRPVQ